MLVAKVETIYPVILKNRKFLKKEALTLLLLVEKLTLVIFRYPLQEPGLTLKVIIIDRYIALQIFKSFTASP
jgi:hypothetical protein